MTATVTDLDALRVRFLLAATRYGWLAPVPATPGQASANAIDLTVDSSPGAFETTFVRFVRRFCDRHADDGKTPSGQQAAGL